MKRVIPSTPAPPCAEFQRHQKAGQYLIGITGGIGSGKTTVTAMIHAAGYPVMSSDDIGRELTSSNPALQEKIVELFPDVRNPDGSINRLVLASKVFGETPAHTRALAKLNTIIHPAVYKELAEKISEYFIANERYVFNESALLFETGLFRCYNLTVVVDASEDIRVARLSKHRGLNAKDTRKRIAAQIPAEQKKTMADYIIDNHGSLDDLQHNVTLFLQQITTGTLHLKPTHTITPESR